MTAWQYCLYSGMRCYISEIIWHWNQNLRSTVYSPWQNVPPD